MEDVGRGNDGRGNRIGIGLRHNHQRDNAAELPVVPIDLIKQAFRFPVKVYVNLFLNVKTIFPTKIPDRP